MGPCCSKPNPKSSNPNGIKRPERTVRGKDDFDAIADKEDHNSQINSRIDNNAIK